MRSFIFNNKSEFQRGQILLAMVLTLVVVMTVGVSVASRSITNVRVSRQNEESSRAFQAAEAGIQQLLQEQVEDENVSTLSNQVFSDSNATFTTRETSSTGGNNVLLYGNATIDQDIGAYVKLPSGNADLTIYYGESNQTQCNGSTGRNIPPALEIVVLSNPSNPTMEKYLVDQCSQRDISADDPTSGGLFPGTSQSFAYRYQISVNNGIAARIIPIFNSTKIGISSDVPLPEQGTQIESEGSSGETVRRLTYFESNEEIPVELFQYAILSQ